MSVYEFASHSALFVVLFKQEKKKKKNLVAVSSAAIFLLTNKCIYMLDICRNGICHAWMAQHQLEQFHISADM